MLICTKSFLNCPSNKGTVQLANKVKIKPETVKTGTVNHLQSNISKWSPLFSFFCFLLLPLPPPTMSTNKFYFLGNPTSILKLYTKVYSLGKVITKTYWKISLNIWREKKQTLLFCQARQKQHSWSPLKF